MTAPTIGTRVRQALGRQQAWKEAPNLAGPLGIGADELTMLGTDKRGRRWFRHRDPRFGELEEQRKIYTDREELPTALIVSTRDGAGIRHHRAYTAHPPGTFEARMAAVGPAARAATPHRPVDALGPTIAARLPELMVIAPQRDRIVPSIVESQGYVRPAKGPARGAEAILARLAEKGAHVRLATDGTALVVTAAGGRPAPGVTELVTVAKPLLVAYLRDGKAPRCTVTDHDEEAVTVTLGGALACADCMAGDGGRPAA